MGAYLSAPHTHKESTDEANEYLSCGASQMQGWRVSQEVSFQWLEGYKSIYRIIEKKNTPSYKFIHRKYAHIQTKTLHTYYIHRSKTKRSRQMSAVFVHI